MERGSLLSGERILHIEGMAGAKIHSKAPGGSSILEHLEGGQGKLARDCDGQDNGRAL